MTQNTLRNWEPKTVDLTDAGTAYKVAEIGAGQSVLIKSLGSSGTYIELYPSKDFVAGQGARIHDKESMTFTLPREFGIHNIIEVWAVAQTAGDDVNVTKILDTFLEIGSSENLG